ncbi:MAG TPA: glycosyltransferase [Pseudonocardia sp.]|nr:glycosyltransferase [Pseudonocardia sp.]
MGSNGPRVAILSLREIRPVANYGGLREAEDALVDALAAGLYRVVLSSPRFSRGTLAKPAVRAVLNTSRVVHPYRIEHHQRRDGAPADVLLVLARDLGDASVLVGLPGWNELGDRVIVHIESVTDWDLRRYADLMGHLRRKVDALFCACEMPPLGYLRTMHGRLSTVDVVPPVLDVLAFPVRSDPGHRTIDVFCPGPAPAAQNQLLRQWASLNDGSYQQNIGQLGAINSLDQHRKIFTSMATRARVFLTNHERYSQRQIGPGRDGYQSVNTRFYEAMAAGCVLIGDLPHGSRQFAEYVRPAGPLNFPLDADRLPDDVYAVLDDKEHAQKLGAVARATALRRNDVAHRWKHMATLAGIPTSPGIEARIRQLAEQAERVEAGGAETANGR